MGLILNLLFQQVPYARHHNPLLITNRSWILTIHKDKIFWKNLLENKEMVFKNRVKNIQAAAYNGFRTIHKSLHWFRKNINQQIFLKSKILKFNQQKLGFLISRFACIVFLSSGVELQDVLWIHFSVSLFVFVMYVSQYTS